MAHTHAYGASPTPDEMGRHRRALRIMVVLLIPLGIWTAADLIAFWPDQVSSHIQQDVSGYSVAGVTYPKARITKITESSCEGAAGSTPGVDNQVCADVGTELLSGPEQGQTVQVALTDAIYASGTKVGQKIKLVRVPPADQQPAQYQFSDFERGTPLVVLALAFAAAVIVVARWRGFASLVGLAFAGFILVKFMFPALISGTNPLLVGLVGSSAIMFVTLYAAHGFSAQTTTALVGTLFGLILIAALGYATTRWAHLTGVSTEDDYVLTASAPDLRLTSIAKASLPVLLLIAIYDRPLLQVVQTEQFAGEIIRTLVGSIGLVLAVPLTTAVGVAVVRASGRRLLLSPSSEAIPEARAAGRSVVLKGAGRRQRVTFRGRDQDDIDFSDLRDPAAGSDPESRPR